MARAFLKFAVLSVFILAACSKTAPPLPGTDKILTDAERLPAQEKAFIAKFAKSLAAKDMDALMAMGCWEGSMTQNKEVLPIVLKNMMDFTEPRVTIDVSERENKRGTRFTAPYVGMLRAEIGDKKTGRQSSAVMAGLKDGKYCLTMMAGE